MSEQALSKMSKLSRFVELLELPEEIAAIDRLKEDIAAKVPPPSPTSSSPAAVTEVTHGALRCSPTHPRCVVPSQAPLKKVSPEGAILVGRPGPDADPTSPKNQARRAMMTEKRVRNAPKEMAELKPGTTPLHCNAHCNPNPDPRAGEDTTGDGAGQRAEASRNVV